MTERTGSRSGGELSADKNCPSVYFSGQCLALGLGSQAVLFIRPFDPGEQDVISWAEAGSYNQADSVSFLSCGYDVIVCSRLQHDTNVTHR